MNEREARKHLEKFGPEMEKKYQEAKANLLDSFSERVKKGLLTEDEFERIKKSVEELDERRKKKWVKKR